MFMFMKAFLLFLFGWLVVLLTSAITCLHAPTPAYVFICLPQRVHKAVRAVHETTNYVKFVTDRCTCQCYYPQPPCQALA